MRVGVNQKGRYRKDLRDICYLFLLGIIIIIIMMFILKYLLIFLVTNSVLVFIFLDSLEGEKDGII